MATPSVGTFFGGSSVRVAGVNGVFDWHLPLAGSVGAVPTVTLFSDPGYSTVAVAAAPTQATADPTVWSAPYPSTLAPGAYWVEGTVTWYGAQTPVPPYSVPYRGHVLILTDPTADTVTPPPWAPTLDELAALVPHRTQDESGTKQYHFSATTRPPASFAQIHLTAAVEQERADFGDIGGRLGAKVKRAALYLAAATMEESLKPSSDVAASSDDEPSVQRWYDWYNDTHAKALSMRGAGVIGSPRQPGAVGQRSPGYGPHSRWRGGGW